MNNLICVCGVQFTTKSNLNRHKKTCINKSTNNNIYKCEYCKKDYTRIDNFQTHLKTCKIKKIGENNIDLPKAEFCAADMTVNIKKIIEEQIEEIKLQADAKVTKHLTDMKEGYKKELEQELEVIKVQNQLNSPRNKHTYKLLKAEKYEEPDLNNVSIEDILKAIDDSDNVLDADKKLYEYFYMQTDPSRNSSIRIPNLRKDKMLVATDNYKWKNKEVRDYCKKLIEKFEYKFYCVLCEYFNNKLHDLNILTTDELEILMRTSKDTIYKHLWKIHLIVSGNFFRDQSGTRSYEIARHISEVQVPPNAIHRGEYLFISDDDIMDNILQDQIKQIDKN